MNLSVVYLLCVLLICRLASANVVLIGNNVTLSFDDIEANFGLCFFLLAFCWVLWKCGKMRQFFFPLIDILMESSGCIQPSFRIEKEFFFSPVWQWNKCSFLWQNEIISIWLLRTCGKYSFLLILSREVVALFTWALELGESDYLSMK